MNEITVAHLVDTHCKPFLVYGLKTVAVQKSAIESLSYSYKLAVKKIFNADWNNVNDEMTYVGLKHIGDCIKSEREKFLRQCEVTDNGIINFLVKFHLGSRCMYVLMKFKL